MPVFQRVDHKQAGPYALGILIPPGQRTILIIRPKSLQYDFLAIKPADVNADVPTFCNFDRDEAAELARKVKTSLEAASEDVVTVHDNPWGDGYVAWVSCAELLWIPCHRRPGQAYQGALFLSEDEAKEVSMIMRRCFCPSDDEIGQIYFNTQHFHG
ncbi:MAG: hypothetical protein ACFCD0_07875 [Gemmataceae bacterium]